MEIVAGKKSEETTGGYIVNDLKQCQKDLMKHSETPLPKVPWCGLAT